MEKHRYALRLAYHGGAFRGFQRQPGLPTVQGAVEEALAPIGLRLHLDAAARTDAGVHALDQVVTFSTRSALDPDALRAEVNARTPPELLCLAAARVAPGVHARASALSRRYVYLVGWPAPPELTGYAWTLPDRRAFPSLEAPRVEVDRAAEALAAPVGEHDFGGLARPGDQTARRRVSASATVRTVTRAEVIGAADRPFCAIVLEGRGFLRAMVRNLVGAAVSVAVGAVGPETIPDALRHPDRRYRGVRAPAWGLTLCEVVYPRPLFGPPPGP